MNVCKHFALVFKSDRRKLALLRAQRHSAERAVDVRFPKFERHLHEHKLRPHLYCMPAHLP